MEVRPQMPRFCQYACARGGPDLAKRGVPAPMMATRFPLSILMTASPFEALESISRSVCEFD